MLDIRPSSRKLYRWYWKEITIWAKENRIRMRLMSENQFLQFIEERNYAKNTARCFLYSIKKHMNGKWFRLKNLKIKVQNNPTPPLSRREYHLLVNSIDTSTEKGKRDLAQVRLFVDSAPRTSEVCAMNLSELNLEDRNIRFFSMKGQCNLRTPFGYKTKWALQQYLKVRDSDDPALFVSTRTGKRMTRGGLKVTIYRLGKKAGINRLYPHRLRATAATAHSDLGTSTRKVQLLGHWSNLKDVERYTHFLRADDFDKFPSDDWED